MDIEFIKWKVSYAEEFEESNWGGSPVIKYRENVIRTSGLLSWSLYPLLLQRAIEGINQANHKNRIEIAYNMIEVLDSEEYTVLKSFRVDQMTNEYDLMTFDQAKEQALKYIWKHKK